MKRIGKRTVRCAYAVEADSCMEFNLCAVAPVE